MNLARIHLTAELCRCIAAIDSGPVGPTVERLLWNSKQIKDAAKSLGIKKPPRPTVGRPKADKARILAMHKAGKTVLEIEKATKSKKSVIYREIKAAKGKR